MGDPSNATLLLQDALDEEDAELVAEAIAQSADVNALWEYQTLLSAAAQIGKPELIRLLLAAGADPNRKHPDGTTALTWSGSAEVTALLLDAGASARYECGKRVEYSSLHNAAGDGNTARLKLLLERGDAECLLNQFDAMLGMTPLHWAANEGHCEAAQLLLDAGADPNLVQEACYTAISLAASRDHVDMVKLLLAAGADPALDSGMLPSALDVARQHANPELLKCIEEALDRARGAPRRDRDDGRSQGTE